MLRPFINAFLVITLFVSACTEDHHIKVEKNGSANVTYSLHWDGNDNTAKVKLDTADIAETKDSLYRICNKFSIYHQYLLNKDFK